MSPARKPLPDDDATVVKTTVDLTAGTLRRIDAIAAAGGSRSSVITAAVEALDAAPNDPHAPAEG